MLVLGGVPGEKYPGIFPQNARNVQVYPPVES